MRVLLIPMAITAIAGLGACQGASAVDTPHQTRPVACQAADYQNYVGRQRSEIPAAPTGRIFRVLCSTCAATMDYRDNRVNFTFDEATGRVTRVSCG